MPNQQQTTRERADLIARHWTPERRPHEHAAEPDHSDDKQRSSWETGDTHS